MFSFHACLYYAKLVKVSQCTAGTKVAALCIENLET